MPLFAQNLDSLAHASVRAAITQARNALAHTHQPATPHAPTTQHAPTTLHAVDATAGNGHDTLFLARCLGQKQIQGHVWAFDVQEAALTATRQRVDDARRNEVAAGGSVLAPTRGPTLAPVTYIHAGHEQAAQHVAPALAAPTSPAITGSHTGPHTGPVNALMAVMFNLGYLPQSDKSCITRPHTTLAALSGPMPLLHKGGVISLHVYTGHPQGAEEYEALADFCRALPYSQWQSLCMHTQNKSQRAEYLFLLHKAVSSRMEPSPPPQWLLAPGQSNEILD